MNSKDARSFNEPSERTLDVFREALRRQAAAVEEYITGLQVGPGAQLQAGAIVVAVDTILGCGGKLILTGVGKSGHIARKLAATFSSTGTPSFFLHPAEADHGDRGVLTADDVLLVVTKSGESDELVRLIRFAQDRGMATIAIVGNADSSTARVAEHTIITHVPLEAGPLGLAPTSSTTLALVIGDALALAVATARGFGPEDFADVHPGGNLGRVLNLKVRDTLPDNRKLPVVSKEVDMRRLLQESNRPNLGGVLVLSEDGRLEGIVTDGDIRRAILKHGDILDVRIEDVMSRNPVSVTPDTPAVEALRLMENRPSQISLLPVLDETGKPVALLRLHDLVRAGL